MIAVFTTGASGNFPGRVGGFIGFYTFIKDYIDIYATARYQ